MRKTYSCNCHCVAPVAARACAVHCLPHWRAFVPVRVSVSAEEGGFFADSEEGAASAAARAQWEARLSLNPNPKPNTTPTLTLP